MPSAPAWAWTTFGITLAILLAADLFLHGHYRTSRRAALAWSAVWISAGLAFAVFVGYAVSADAAHQYVAAYLIEESLSLDNLFLFLVIFTALGIPQRNHHRALFWGIFGALLFRGVFIFAGVEALQHWQWLDWVFAALLLYAAYHALREDPRQETHSKAADWLSRRLPVSGDVETSRFVIREHKRIVPTPLLLAVLAIEVSDVVFAVDSVPAALSVSRHEFVVYSSNAFAILGLRAVYVVLVDLLRRLAYINYGLAAVLSFAAGKLAMERWIEIPPLVSTGIIAGILALTLWLSLRRRRAAAYSGAAG